MFEGVVAPGTAHLFNTADQEAEAVEVLRSIGIIRNIITNYLLEKRINELTMINFLLELIVGLFSAHSGSLSGKGVELMVTRVNDFNVVLFLSSDLLVHVVGLVHHIHDEIIGVGLKGALEVTDRFIQEGLVSKDLDGAHVRLCLHICVLSAEGL